jgi:thiamine-monophosphate kinase
MPPKEPRTEDEFIEQLTDVWKAENAAILWGPGDDCALLKPSTVGYQRVLKTDAVVQNVHFQPTDAPEDVGHKALGRVLSDFGAMGATPESALITIGIPTRVDVEFMRRCYRGMARLASRWKVGLAGGELVRSRILWLSIAGTGIVRRGQAVSRKGAKPGDALCVTGRLGGAFPERHLKFEPRLPEGQWLASRNYATSMMDLSDGLGKDLPRLARASGVSFSVDPSWLPRHRGVTPEQAVNDGEDYELLFTVRAGQIDVVRRLWPFETPITVIGQMLHPSEENRTGGVSFSGFDHIFNKRKRRSS